MKIPGAGFQLSQQMTAILNLAGNHMYDTAFPLNHALDLQHAGVHDRGPIAFHQIKPHHNVAVAGFVFQGDKYHAGGGARPHLQLKFWWERFSNGEIEVIVPDLIVVLDADSGEAISTEMLRYGQRVAVLALPCHPLLRSPEALDVVGPKGFGFGDIAFKPMDTNDKKGAA